MHIYLFQQFSAYFFVLNWNASCDVTYTCFNGIIRKKRKEYLNEGGENCVMRRSMVYAVTQYYQGDIIEDDEMGGL
jgi:hypothetical protein